MDLTPIKETLGKLRERILSMDAPDSKERDMVMSCLAGIQALLELLILRIERNEEIQRGHKQFLADIRQAGPNPERRPHIPLGCHEKHGYTIVKERRDAVIKFVVLQKGDEISRWHIHGDSLVFAKIIRASMSSPEGPEKEEEERVASENCLASPEMHKWLAEDILGLKPDRKQHTPHIRAVVSCMQKGKGSTMGSYNDCIAKARRMEGFTPDQVIQMANGMYLAESVKTSIENAVTMIYKDDGGYRGLRSLLDQAYEMCKRMGK